MVGNWNKIDQKFISSPSVIFYSINCQYSQGRQGISEENYVIFSYQDTFHANILYLDNNISHTVRPVYLRRDWHLRQNRRCIYILPFYPSYFSSHDSNKLVVSRDENQTLVVPNSTEGKLKLCHDKKYLFSVIGMRWEHFLGRANYYSIISIFQVKNISKARFCKDLLLRL